MSGKVLIEMSHEDHYRLMEILRVSKAENFYMSPIIQARRLLGLPMESRWKFNDWTAEDEQAEQKREAEMYAFPTV